MSKTKQNNSFYIHSMHMQYKPTGWRPK